MHYIQAIKNIRSQTDTILLFHSGTGKDSIMMCDLLSKNFKRVVCVFMYMVKDLEYENRYIDWALDKYDNISFEKTPHFATYSFLKHGYLGLKKSKDVKNVKLKDITASMKLIHGIDYACFGFKKIDSIDRRIMLNELPDGISPNTKNCYPIMDCKNSDVLRYIDDNQLIIPFNYNKQKPSSGCDISDPTFLSYMKNRYPSDLQKIFNTYPYCEAILFRYENQTK